MCHAQVDLQELFNRVNIRFFVQWKLPSPRRCRPGKGSWCLVFLLQVLHRPSSSRDSKRHRPKIERQHINSPTITHSSLLVRPPIARHSSSHPVQAQRHRPSTRLDHPTIVSRRSAIHGLPSRAPESLRGNRSPLSRLRPSISSTTPPTPLPATEPTQPIAARRACAHPQPPPFPHPRNACHS